MSPKTKIALLAVVLLDFTATLLWALNASGLGAFAEAVATPGAVAATVDLCIALGIGVAFMWPDARKRGVNPLPYAVATLLLGSPGLLIYLISRELPAVQAPVAA